MKNAIKLLISAAITVAIGGIGYYFYLPPLNVFSIEFWLFLAAFLILYAIIYTLVAFGVQGFSILSKLKLIKEKSSNNKTVVKNKMTVTQKVLWGLVTLPLIVSVVGLIVSSTFFNAVKYSEIISVKEAVFEEDMPETTLVTNIPLMDSSSAQIIGDRTLGALSEVVSQYRVNGSYSQINFLNTPQKVSSLEYVDFFKWLNNRESGIPGYVMVDPVNSSAEYKRFSTPISYSESAYFNDDLGRKLRFSYPTKIFGSCIFEIDNNGNPYYIVSCMKPKVGMFGGMDVNEVIIFNPCDGSSQLYALGDVPSWVDNVFTGTLASQKYDWFGTLKNGFWNSVIGNKDCKVTTDDFGYIVLGDDIWFFTGVTSVSSDESNIGFIISNARTGEYKFYPVIGAEEYSAMGAAQGEVQEKGYVASFPSLINVSGEATYIMVLKDANGIVKLYALVNVENYSIVATGSTQTEAKQAYVALLHEEGIITEDELPESNEPEKEVFTADVTAKSVRIATVGGESWIYISCNDGNVYKQCISKDEAVMLIQENHNLKIEYYDTEINGIRQIVKWDFVTGGK